MMIETGTSSCSKPKPRPAQTTPQTLVIPAMIAALLMAAALSGCSGASRNAQLEPTALLIHTQAVGQDNGSLTGNFVIPQRSDRRNEVVYAASARRIGAPR